jgi:xylulose-5-phosphate/fructose-6-phosphate phosphoketolase
MKTNTLTLESLHKIDAYRRSGNNLAVGQLYLFDNPLLKRPLALADIKHMDFDEPFTKNKPVIFAFHDYPWLIHRLTYRRTNYNNFHLRSYKEEGAITTPFDMTVLNDLDRFHLEMDTIDCLPQTNNKGIYLKQQLKKMLIEHKHYIDKYGQDLPEIRNWKWEAHQNASTAK